MNIPLWLLKLLPTWEYICPKCRKTVKPNSHECPHCGEHYPQALRIPPTFIKDKKKLEDYVHTHIFPRISKFERDYLTQYFTILFSDGFESGDFSNWTSTNNSPTIVTTPVNSGNYSAQLSTANQSSATKTFGSSYNQLNFRFYVRWDANPNSGEYVGIAYLYNAWSDFYQVLVKNDSGTMKWGVSNYSVSNANYFTSPNPATNTWYCVEAQGINGTSFTLFVNGSQVGTFTSVAIEGANFNGVCIISGAGGTVSSYPNFFFDDCVVADTSVGPLSTRIATSKKITGVGW